MSLAPFVGISRAGGGLFAARAEVGIVQKGFERSEPTAHWTYLELPIVVEARFRPSHAALRPTLQLGLAPSVALDCSISYVGVSGPYHGTCFEPDPLDLVTPASRWDVGAVLGAGVRLRLAPATIVVDGRYTRGLHHVERGSTHRVWSIGVGAAVPFSQ